jgi:hypothetical protein
MNKPPFVSITDDGAQFLADRPEAHLPGKHDYSKKPVRVAIQHDLSLELHGEHFSVKTKLTPEEALGLISMLGFFVRENLSAGSLRK